MLKPLIEQLKKEHFEEALDFINMVFSLASRPTNFNVILPDLYQPTDVHMSCHHVIREKGRIKALVGIYPGMYVIGDETLFMARIGAVSTHPDARMKGYMTTLMEHVQGVMKKEGYDLAYLGGARHRYLPFGFEKCGSQPVFHVTKRSLERGIGSHEHLVLSVCDEDSLEIDRFHDLYESQVSYFKRDRQSFHRIGSHWYNTIFQIKRDNQPVGYLIASKDRKTIEEIVLEEGIDVRSVIKTHVESSKIESCRIVVHPLNPKMMHEIFTISEDVSVHDRDNWSILDVERVLSAFMRVRHRMTPLVSGNLIIGISDHGTYDITVDVDRIAVSETTASPDLSLSYSDAHRLFFGPLKPHQIIDLPSRLTFIEQWFPLPLFLSRPDYA